MTHLTWDELNDYADGSMAPSARADASNHLDACAECRDTVARVRALLASAKTAPPTMEPPANAWNAIRATIQDKKVVQLPRVAERTSPNRLFRLVAAAVILIVASSATTVLIMGRNLLRVPPGTLLVTERGTARTGRGDSGALPASFVEEERGYLKTVDELTAALNKSRDKLAPETVKTVEHSLQIIDDAIAEARTALAHDPANPLLRDFLTKHYEQKVDFLRRVSGRTT